MSLVALGSAIGLTLAAGARRILTAFVTGVLPTDSIIFIGATVLFATIGLAACYVPARRATRVEAMEALRYE